MLVILAVLAACDTSIPTPPPINIGVTMVPNSTALGQAVAEALTATGQANAYLTETVIANNGMTLTPSTTPTITPTSTITPTRRVTATPTALPSDTLTPTYLPLVSNTPAPAANQSYGWVRFVNRWFSTDPQAPSVPVDVFVNDDRIARGVEYGSETNYYQVAPGSIRISIRNVDQAPNNAKANVAIVTTVVDVPPGGIITMLAMKLNEINLYAIREDPSPLAVGASRLTIIQANPALPPVNIDIADQRLRLASNLTLGNIVGPIDVPAGHFSIDLNDVRGDSVSTISNFPLNLTGQVSNFLIFLPPPKLNTGILTIDNQWTGLTARVKDDIGVRFINALSNIGSVQITIGQAALDNFELGQISPSIPVPIIGARFIVSNGNDTTIKIDDGVLGPYTTDPNPTADKIVLLLPDLKITNRTTFIPVTFSQNPPRSSINASVRLIHALAGAVPLNLQIRPLRTATTAADGTGQQPEAATWATVAQSEYNTGSAYFSRNPDIYSIRVVQSGSQTVIAELPPQQLLAGGIYDFVVAPGAQPGSAQLLMVQPSVQITQLVQGSGNPTAVYEAVSSTLTALAPIQVVVTVTQTFTPTPTRTPIPTNTPRPTNTPELKQPLVNVNPAPPDTTVGTISLVGENFRPKLQYVITIDDNPTPILTGQVNDDGTVLESIPLASNLSPGVHSLKVCADCRTRGVQQAAYAQFIVAIPGITPTATTQP